MMMITLGLIRGTDHKLFLQDGWDMLYLIDNAFARVYDRVISKSTLFIIEGTVSRDLHIKIQTHRIRRI